MSNTTPSADNPFKESTDAMGEQTANRVTAAKESLSDIAKTATDQLNEARETAADRLKSAASTVYDRSEQLPGGPRVKEIAHAAAERLSSTADYMRSHDVAHIRADIETLVKNNPGPALVVAAAFGFVLARALSRE